jgi:16S rRNA (guanine527-N7)-methyltransferase
MDKLVSGARKLGLTLTPDQVARFQKYYEELVDWNRRVNLTAIIDYEQVQVRHFLDSLTVALAFSEARRSEEWRLLDVGTGAGLPGVPLKILFPQVKLVLLDSVAKKTRFLHHLVTCLRLEGTTVVTGRAEEIAHRQEFREKFDLVVSRAVGKLAILAELTLPFCRVGGSFVAPKKGQIREEISQAGRALSLLGGRLREVKGIELEELGERRLLLIVEKVSATPKLYPRRPGVPMRHPL